MSNKLNSKNDVSTPDKIVSNQNPLISDGDWQSIEKNHVLLLHALRFFLEKSMLLFSAPTIHWGFLFHKFCQIFTFYSILYLILRYTKEEAEVQKQALQFVPAR